MRTEVGSIQYAATHTAVGELRDAWFSYLSHAGRSALHAFDSMPIHELGGADAVRHAFEIRSQFEHLAAFLEKHLATLQLRESNDNAEEALITAEYERVTLAALQKGINLSKERIDGLYEKFAATAQT